MPWCCTAPYLQISKPKETPFFFFSPECKKDVWISWLPRHCHSVLVEKAAFLLFIDWINRWLIIGTRLAAPLNAGSQMWPRLKTVAAVLFHWILKHLAQRYHEDIDRAERWTDPLRSRLPSAVRMPNLRYHICITDPVNPRGDATSDLSSPWLPVRHWNRLSYCSSRRQIIDT